MRSVWACLRGCMSNIEDTSKKPRKNRPTEVPVTDTLASSVNVGRLWMVNSPELCPATWSGGKIIEGICIRLWLRFHGKRLTPPPYDHIASAVRAAVKISASKKCYSD